MTTKIKPGVLIRDNDPRSNRTGEVITVDDHKLLRPQAAVRWSTGAVTRISIDRIHADAKPRSDGYSLVSDAPPAPSEPSIEAMRAAARYGHWEHWQSAGSDRANCLPLARLLDEFAAAAIARAARKLER